MSSPKKGSRRFRSNHIEPHKFWSHTTLKGYFFAKVDASVLGPHTRCRLRSSDDASTLALLTKKTRSQARFHWWVLL